MQIVPWTGAVRPADLAVANDAFADELLELANQFADLGCTRFHLQIATRLFVLSDDLARLSMVQP